MMDAVHHLMYFALNLMTSGRIDDVVDAEYINSLEWYHSLPEILAGEVDKDDGVAARGEGHLPRRSTIHKLLAAICDVSTRAARFPAAYSFIVDNIIDDGTRVICYG